MLLSVRHPHQATCRTHPVIFYPGPEPLAGLTTRSPSNINAAIKAHSRVPLTGGAWLRARAPHSTPGTRVTYMHTHTGLNQLNTRDERVPSSPDRILKFDI